LIFVCALPASAQLERALELQRQGHAQQALTILEGEIPTLRATRDQTRLAQVLAAAAEACLASGKYQAALQYSKEALGFHESRNDTPAQARDWNTLGLADMYLGGYAASLHEFEQALALDRRTGDHEGEIARLNNLGNVYYFQGRYLEALQSFSAAFEKVNASSGETWNPRRRQITIANLATIYQRLGDEEKALALYSQPGASPSAVRPSEAAQMLLNKGVLYRRLGDPLKALELYGSAQQLFAKDQHRDGEIGALRNIGIARGLDLQDLPGALTSFQAALRLAKQAGNGRGEVQAELYSGEILRRMYRLDESQRMLDRAVAGAERAGLVEEHWKALYAIGLLAEMRSDPERAARSFTDAIELIETVRAGLQLTPLRTDFLADKRDVYDALIQLRLSNQRPDVAEIFQLIEHSRARTVQDRVANLEEQSMSLVKVQAQLDPDTLLLEYWIGDQSVAAVWMNRGGAGVVTKQFSSADAADVVRFNEALSQGSPGWRSLSVTVGRRLLSGVPLGGHLRHVILVPDGLLEAMPFEVLELPGSEALVIEKFDVSYLPTAALLLNTSPAKRDWRFAWQRQLVAIGDPLSGEVAQPVALQDTEQWQPLPHAIDEIHGIAKILDGRTEQHLGQDAKKTYLTRSRVAAAAPLWHLSTHAAADLQNPERSRIVFAPAQNNAPLDYLFLREIYGLDLRGVDLVTVSACDTQRGKLVRGEGSQGFSRAFLAAGAAASVTSLWRVVDASTAEFMKQFYFGLSRGQSKAEALRNAKLKFLRSGSTLSHPRYWAPFVLSGNGSSPIAAIVPWSVLMAISAVVFAGIALTIMRLR